jgi:hypothetical protein
MGLCSRGKGSGLFVAHMNPFDLFMPADSFKKCVE